MKITLEFDITEDLYEETQARYAINGKHYIFAVNTALEHVHSERRYAEKNGTQVSDKDLLDNVLDILREVREMYPVGIE